MRSYEVELHLNWNTSFSLKLQHLPALNNIQKVDTWWYRSYVWLQVVRYRDVVDITTPPPAEGRPQASRKSLPISRSLSFSVNITAVTSRGHVTLLRLHAPQNREHLLSTFVLSDGYGFFSVFEIYVFKTDVWTSLACLIQTLVVRNNV